MSNKLLFITGKLAEKSLRRVLGSIDKPGFDWAIAVPGVSVAALITSDLLMRRLDQEISGCDKIILPGRCRGDLDDLSAHFGVPVERGPEELNEIPAWFGESAAPREINHTDMLLFAEIVDAPQLDIDAVIRRAERYREDGADVIDVGCLPDTPFPHLAECIVELKDAGFVVSVDSLATAELETGIRAGADYCFSLTDKTIDLVKDSACVPILIGSEPRELDSLIRSIETFSQLDRPFFADPIIDPIHYGFTESLIRYAELRKRFADIEIMMGIGNLSELTHTDSLGLNTLLLGIASELNIRGLLTTEVSAHCRTAVREINRARRVMFAAREDNTPPRHLDESLMALHERHPFVHSDVEIAEFARDVRDNNFRIEVNEEGIHIYNRHGLWSATDPYELFPSLDVGDDGAHAFYLGLELARAEIAWQLGKRYRQDELLDWGCVLPRAADNKLEFSEEKSTFRARRNRNKKEQ